MTITEGEVGVALPARRRRRGAHRVAGPGDAAVPAGRARARPLRRLRPPARRPRRPAPPQGRGGRGAAAPDRPPRARRRRRGAARRPSSRRPDAGLHWRTRMRYHRLPDGRLGLRASRSDRVVPVPECLVEAPDAVVVVEGEQPDRAEVTEMVRGHCFDVATDGFWQVHRDAPETLLAGGDVVRRGAAGGARARPVRRRGAVHGVPGRRGRAAGTRRRRRGRRPRRGARPRERGGVPLGAPARRVRGRRPRRAGGERPLRRGGPRPAAGGREAGRRRAGGGTRAARGGAGRLRPGGLRPRRLALRRERLRARAGARLRPVPDDAPRRVRGPARARWSSASGARQSRPGEPGFVRPAADSLAA